MNTQINIRIGGTKQRRAGFAPQVSCGVLAPGEGDNMYRSPMIAENPTFVVKHARDYIFYMLIDRRVRPFDADANGALSIAMSFSSQTQFADGQSPYQLLIELYQYYVANYMEQASDGRLVFRDTDAQNDDPEFRTIVSKYQLVPRRTPYIPMNPSGITGVVCVPQDKLADFFSNTQYREFAAYKDIEVGVNCFNQVNPDLKQLQIPMPPTVYEVWVNGSPAGGAMQLPTDYCEAKHVPNDCFRFKSTTFTLGELLDAPNNRINKDGTTIYIDTSTNRIMCDLAKEAIFYQISYEFVDNAGNAKSDIINGLQTGRIDLKYGDLDISKPHDVKAIDLKGGHPTISPTKFADYRLRVESEKDDATYQLLIRIIINKAPTQEKYPNPKSQQGKQRPVGIGDNPNNRKNQNKEEDQNATDKQLAEKSVFDKKQAKQHFIKGLIVGLIVGLLLGIGGYLAISALTGGSTKSGETATEAEIPDSAATGGGDRYVAANLPEGSGEQDTTEVIGQIDGTIPTSETATDEEAKEASAKAKAAADAETKAKAEEEKANKREEILRLVNKKDLASIKKIWDGILSKQEKDAIETVLGSYSGTSLKRVEKILNRKFNKFEDIITAHEEIKKKLME